ncbi:Fmp16p KNAG_0D01920 [Huiozyma naganishii CBS 8797]|uniref:Uncharacterized protein n=1 Tax=Huiozyma naganishii (strain ATCC MYA-139 / BCRC 22969 / CBS 8797 / KCTC 17520 / NBRC 10181 / NCYC 3082 / Yp74L-3) TaxID=1071383 RepID=J7RKA4_HUIN7|nr:hypothetical protein KNAG_0D01920 [Kazachstania naganishii CBS 8797]CCK69943.1 hypothetical protein KNAG_0D01920 [Kazachstania naganishii CBS 8797]
MLRQVTRPVGPLLTRRAFSSSFAPRNHHDKLKSDQSTEEKKEQKLFDKNKARLEKLETGKGPRGFKRPSEKALQEKGENARIEQNRPDDGVY